MSRISEIIESLFPSYCVGCRTRGGEICRGCARVLPPAQAPESTWITSIFAYQDPRIRKLIHLLKFKNRKRVARFFAPYIATAIKEFLGEEGHFISTQSFLVPIPLSRNRQKIRGYNQAELLAREAVPLVGEGVVLRTDILRKTKETIAQTDMKKRSERMKNISDCFSIEASPDDIRATVILIDDVTTTGATLSTARKALKEAGFRKVYALTVAH